MAIDQHSRVFFMHIMKTGGTSFAGSIGDQFPAEAVYPPPGETKAVQYWTFDELLATAPEDLAEIRLLHGHYPLFVGELAGFDRTVTILRDPIERLISHLRQLVRGGFGFSTIEGAYDSPFGAHLVNYQLRQFSRAVDDDPLDLDDRHLRRGIERLDLVELIGFTDRFDAFVDRCRETLGWDVTAGPRLQVATGDVVVDPAFRRRLERDNELDLEFYRHVRRHRG